MMEEDAALLIEGKSLKYLNISQPPKSIHFACEHEADRKLIQVRSMRIYVFLSK
jgi:hypothetical protein